MKKVIFLINDLNSGGIENYLLRFLKYYDGQIIATVVCKSGEFGILKNKYESINNIDILPFKLGSYEIYQYLKFYKFCKNQNFDTIVDFTGNFAGLPLFFAFKAGIKNRISFYRGSTNRFLETFFKLKFNSFLNILVYKYSSTILSNSQAAFDFFFKNRMDNRFCVIYNGIDAEKFLDSQQNLREELNIPTNAFVVGHVGRYSREKNHETIFKVAEELCLKYPNMYFIMCGKDVDLSLSNIDIELNSRIITLGYRDDVVNVLKTMDLFYFPSLSEGQPNALIEALISDLNFVASNIESIKETLPVSHHHFLIDPLDSSAALNLIDKLYIKSVVQKKLKHWAIKNFNHKELFELFYKKL